MSITEYKKINISSVLKLLREYKNITTADLSKHLNINFHTFKQYEFEENVPPISTLILLSNFFNVSIDSILNTLKSKYINNIELLELASKIDLLTFDQRYKIESTVETLIKNNDMSSFDSNNLILNNNIHNNIKLLRIDSNITQKELADILDVNQATIAQYEKSKNPSPQNIIKISQYFNISIHALITGQKLHFNFLDKAFENTILKADRQLALDDQKFIIKLMKKIIET